MIGHHVVVLVGENAGISYRQLEEWAAKRDRAPGIAISTSAVTDNTAIISAHLVAIAKVAKFGDTTVETVQAVISDCSVDTANVLGCTVVLEVLDPELVVIELEATLIEMALGFGWWVLTP